MATDSPLTKRLMRPLQKAFVFAALNLPPGVVDGAASLTSGSAKKLDATIENVIEDIEDSVANNLAEIAKNFGPNQTGSSQQQNTNNFTNNSQNGIMDETQTQEAPPVQSGTAPENKTPQTQQSSETQIPSAPETDPTQGGELSPEPIPPETEGAHVPNKSETTSGENAPQTNTQTQQGTPDPNEQAKTEAQQNQIANQRRSLTARQQELQQQTKNTREQLTPLQAKRAKLVKMKWAIATPQYILMAIFFLCLITIVLMFTGIPEVLAIQSVRLGAKKKRLQTLIDGLDAKIQPLIEKLKKEEKEANKKVKQKTQLNRF